MTTMESSTKLIPPDLNHHHVQLATQNPTRKPSPRPTWSAPSPPTNNDCCYGGNVGTCNNDKKTTFDCEWQCVLF